MKKVLTLVFNIFIWVLFGISIILFIFGVVSPIAVHLLFNPGKPILDFNLEVTKEIGAVGDWLGGSATPFLTAASFLILLAAYLAQKQELSLTRKEFSAQHDTFKHQKYDNTFFNLLNLHQQNIERLYFSESVQVRTGIYEEDKYQLNEYSANKAINFFYKYIKDQFKYEEGYRENLIVFDFFKHKGIYLNSILVNIDFMFEFIETHDDEDSKKMYYNLLIAQISDQLLVIYLLWVPTISEKESTNKILLLKKLKMITIILTRKLGHDSPKIYTLLARTYENESPTT